MKLTDRTKKPLQEQILTVLEFKAANDKWAIPALDIVRIIENQQVFELPQQNVPIKGYIDYNQEQTPFLSLGLLLEGVDNSNGPMVILDHDQGLLALGLAQVYNLVRIPSSSLMKLPKVIEDTTFSTSIENCYFDSEGKIIPIVNLKAIEF
jgi:chemotaxis signal transduction protein